MIKTVMECDYCSDQEDWTDMRKDAIPNGWRSFHISEYNSDGEALEPEPIKITICPKHDHESVTTIMGIALT